VNLGARLCSAAGPGEILVSGSVWDATKRKFSYNSLDPINVKGKKDKISVYQIKT
jgi:class 3 adenylate cyclase